MSKKWTALEQYPTSISEKVNLLYRRIAQQDGTHPIPKKYLKAALEINHPLKMLLPHITTETILLLPTLVDLQSMKRAFAYVVDEERARTNSTFIINEEETWQNPLTPEEQNNRLAALQRYTTGDLCSNTEHGYHLVLMSVLRSLSVRFEDALNSGFFYDRYESSFIMLVHLAASPFLYESEKGEVLFSLVLKALLREASQEEGDVSQEEGDAFGIVDISTNFLDNVLKFANKMKNCQA